MPRDSYRRSRRSCPPSCPYLLYSSCDLHSRYRNGNSARYYTPPHTGPRRGGHPTNRISRNNRSSNGSRLVNSLQFPNNPHFVNGMTEIPAQQNLQITNSPQVVQSQYNMQPMLVEAPVQYVQLPYAAPPITTSQPVMSNQFTMAPQSMMLTQPTMAHQSPMTFQPVAGPPPMFASQPTAAVQPVMAQQQDRYLPYPLSVQRPAPTCFEVEQDVRLSTASHHRIRNVTDIPESPAQATISGQTERVDADTSRPGDSPDRGNSPPRDDSTRSSMANPSSIQALPVTPQVRQDVIHQNISYCLQCNLSNHFWNSICSRSFTPFPFPHYVEFDSTISDEHWDNIVSRKPADVATFGYHLWRFEQRLFITSTFARKRNTLLQNLINANSCAERPARLGQEDWQNLSTLPFYRSVRPYEVYASAACRLTNDFIKTLCRKFQKLLQEGILDQLGWRAPANYTDNHAARDRKYDDLRRLLRAAQGRNSMGRRIQGASPDVVPLPARVLPSFVLAVRAAETSYSLEMDQLSSEWVRLTHRFPELWVNLNNARRDNANEFAFKVCRLRLEAPTVAALPKLVRHTFVDSDQDCDLDEILDFPPGS